MNSEYVQYGTFQVIRLFLSCRTRKDNFNMEDGWVGLHMPWSPVFNCSLATDTSTFTSVEIIRVHSASENFHRRLLITFEKGSECGSCHDSTRQVSTVIINVDEDDQFNDSSNKFLSRVYEQLGLARIAEPKAPSRICRL